MKKNIKLMLWRIFLTIGTVLIVFWGIWNYYLPVPETKLIFNFSPQPLIFKISRLWDIIFAPLGVVVAIFIYFNVNFRKELLVVVNYKLFLIYGLFLGILIGFLLLKFQEIIINFRLIAELVILVLSCSFVSNSGTKKSLIPSLLFCLGLSLGVGIVLGFLLSFLLILIFFSLTVIYHIFVIVSEKIFFDTNFWRKINKSFKNWLLAKDDDDE